MNFLPKLKRPGLIFLFSTFLILIAKASSPYTVSVIEFNDAEFPRVQATLKIEGQTQGLLSKNLEVIEGEKLNMGPLAFLPPHSLPSKIDLTILVDQSMSAQAYQNTIKNNLKGLITYLKEKKIDLKINFSTLDDTLAFQTEDLTQALSQIQKLNFSQRINSGKEFSKIEEMAQIQSRPEAEKIMLILNATKFKDTKMDGISGLKMQQVLTTVSKNQDLVFILGQPLQQIHTIKADSPTAELFDFSHHVKGGYLGAFGADLTSLGELILKQSSEHFVLQYFTHYPPSKVTNAQALLYIDGFQASEFNYKVSPATELSIHHIPENELALGDSEFLTVELENKGKAINTVEFNYKNKGGTFISIPFVHDRALSSATKLKYSLALPEEVFSGDYLTYYISAHTPYTSTGNETGAFTLPVNLYDEGILLAAKLTDDKKGVLWSWSGPTVEKGKQFEVWMGDTLLQTTDKNSYLIPLEACNRYQILQIKVIFPDKTKSNPSRPHEFFADGNLGMLSIQEKPALELMMQCLKNKKIETYAQFTASTPEFNAFQRLTLEKTGLYLTKMLHENLWEKVKTGSGYYELLIYIMKFLNKEQYVHYGLEASPVEKILIYKLITKANYTVDLEAGFEAGLSELSARIRGNLSF